MMYLYLFKIDDKKYMATAMSKVNKESTFKFCIDTDEYKTVRVGDAIKVMSINSFAGLKQKLKMLTRDWDLRAYLSKAKLEDGKSIIKFIVFICGEVFINSEVKVIDGEEKLKIWKVDDKESLLNGFEAFGLTENDLTDNLKVLYDV